MKHVYIKPTVRVCQIDSSVILSGSTNVSAKFNPYEDDNNTNIGISFDKSAWGRTNNPD